jgi:WD40 repeat protein
MALSVDGRYALSASGDGTLRWWDLESGRCLHTLQGHTGSVTTVALSADGRFALSGSHDGTLRWWDVEAARCLALYPCEEPVKLVCLGWTPTAQRYRAAANLVDGRVQVFQIETP